MWFFWQITDSFMFFFGKKNKNSYEVLRIFYLFHCRKCLNSLRSFFKNQKRQCGDHTTAVSYSYGHVNALRSCGAAMMMRWPPKRGAVRKGAVDFL